MKSEKRAQKFHTDDASLPMDSASDWSCRMGNLIQPIRSTTQIWIVTRHPGIAALVFQTSLEGKVAFPNVGCFLRLLDNNIIMFAMLFQKRQHEFAFLRILRQ